MAKRQKFDMNSPEAKAITDEIVHGTFMTEGTMVAFPLCFPGASSPIPLDESRITALDITPDGHVYGGTSGFKAHLFVGMFHGVTGMVLDLASIEGATECVAICCAKDKVVACVNGPAGGRVVTLAYQGLPFDLIQEWGFSRPTLEEVEFPLAGERILHATRTADGALIVGITKTSLFTLDLSTGKVTRLAELIGAGRIARDGAGKILGVDEHRALWRFDSASGALNRRAIALPQGAWDMGLHQWACDPGRGKLYLSDDAGALYSVGAQGGVEGPLAKAPLAPVTAMAVTFDGRLFGTCGDGIGRVFSFDPKSGSIKNLGVAASILERRRYGYEFADAVVGRDGQIYFAENDNLGHLWLYFPRIAAGV